VVSEVNRNYSQVDRMWSILPNLYVVHLAVWARLAGVPHSRLDLIVVATTVWSVSGLSVQFPHHGPNHHSTDPSDVQLLAQGRL
jgi:steroid 5-alpha reductase family enzyme